MGKIFLYLRETNYINAGLSKHLAFFLALTARTGSDFLVVWNGTSVYFKLRMLMASHLVFICLFLCFSSEWCFSLFLCTYTIHVYYKGNQEIEVSQHAKIITQCFCIYPFSSLSYTCSHLRILRKWNCCTNHKTSILPCER